MIDWGTTLMSDLKEALSDAEMFGHNAWLYDWRTIVDAAREHLSCGTITDEMVEVGAKAIEAEMTPRMLAQQMLMLTPEVMSQVVLDAVLRAEGT